MPAVYYLRFTSFPTGYPLFILENPMRHLRAAPLCLLIAVMACRPQPAAEPDRGEFQMLADHVRGRMALSYDCSAGGAVVMQGGEIVYEEYFGALAARPGAAPVDSASRFPFYSVSKGFGAGVLAALVSRGVLALDDPVSKYLPYFTGPGPDGGFERGNMTVRHLASHSSGVPRDDSPPRMWPDGDPFHDLVLKFEPGTSFLYSELAMRLLGHVMAAAAGRPYEQLLADYVTGPLGLESVGYIFQGGELGNVVESGVGLDTSRVFFSDEFGAGPYPGSGLYGSLRDIARYAQAWIDGGSSSDGRRVWEDSYTRTAWRNQPPEREPDPAYGQLFWLFPQVGAVVFSGMAGTICAMLPNENMLLVMGLNQRNHSRGWDFATEKLNLARIGHAILAQQNWRSEPDRSRRIQPDLRG
ncbi:MAG: beta-lactamase family protein [Candidatus Glassbacteria bacterium]|nr:beta-lactamase family protein [Candidatus Glassbacteria bacterium]